MTRIVGLSGKARAGKDTAARIMVEKYGFTQLSFAAPLKDMAASVTGVDRVVFDHPELKEKPLKILGDRTPRQVLEIFGIAGRDIHPDFWVDKAFKQIGDSGRYVFSDMRFSNEASAVLKHAGWTVRIERDATDNDALQSKHVSNLALDNVSFDFRVKNNGSLTDFEEQIKSVLWNIGCSSY